MNKIAVITATRSEYGLLSPVIRNLRKKESDDFKVDLIVTGTHLVNEYGYTINEIVERIDHKIESSALLSSKNDISLIQADLLVSFTNLFLQEHYSLVVILGDRFEMLSVAVAAGNTKTPIAHLCGGDTTEGAIDEWIRHSITKISYLHFVTNEDSMRRVIQLGENPARVFNCGSTSIDNIFSMTDISKQEALMNIGLPDMMYCVCTYHPETLDDVDVKKRIFDLLDAIRHFPNIGFIITKSNSDQGGNVINSILDIASKKMENVYVYASLGYKRYLSIMKHAEFVLGNSSSGIIETPAFHIPTVNIGDRQKGRLHSESVINCDADVDSIVNAINIALSNDFKRECLLCTNPYGDGHASERISQKIMDVLQCDCIDLKKEFYNLEFTV